MLCSAGEGGKSVKQGSAIQCLTDIPAGRMLQRLLCRHAALQAVLCRQGGQLYQAKDQGCQTAAGQFAALVQIGSQRPLQPAIPSQSDTMSHVPEDCYA